MATEEEIETAIDELCDDINTTWSGLNIETVEILKRELMEKLK